MLLSIGEAIVGIIRIIRHHSCSWFEPARRARFRNRGGHDAPCPARVSFFRRGHPVPFARFAVSETDGPGRNVPAVQNRPFSPADCAQGKKTSVAPHAGLSTDHDETRSFTVRWALARLPGDAPSTNRTRLSIATDPEITGSGRTRRREPTANPLHPGHFGPGGRTGGVGLSGRGAGREPPVRDRGIVPRTRKGRENRARVHHGHPPQQARAGPDPVFWRPLQIKSPGCWHFRVENVTIPPRYLWQKAAKQLRDHGAYDPKISAHRNTQSFRVSLP